MNNTDLPITFSRQIDAATADLSDKERMIFLMGVSLAMRCAVGAMTDIAGLLRNSVPELLSGPVTIRRVGL